MIAMDLIGCVQWLNLYERLQVVAILHNLCDNALMLLFRPNFNFQLLNSGCLISDLIYRNEERTYLKHLIE